MTFENPKIDPRSELAAKFDALQPAAQAAALHFHLMQELFRTKHEMTPELFMQSLEIACLDYMLMKCEILAKILMEENIKDRGTTAFVTMIESLLERRTTNGRLLFNQLSVLDILKDKGTPQ